jgi:thiol-disulfide isomerase/thioredoxin
MAHPATVPKTIGPSSILLLLCSAAGLGLSIASILQLCSDACSETARYTLFGLDFGTFGILFFMALAAVVLARRRFPPVAVLCPLMLFASMGAEAHFIWIQKYVIGAWCPLCLAIAGSVMTGVIVVAIEMIRELRAPGGTMKHTIQRITLFLAAFALGLGVSVFGVSADRASAATNLYLGKASGPVTVYFVSDWFCPGCRKAEPAIERIYPEVARTARVAFIDYPVHPETSNFTPYNLQFLALEKQKYIGLRRALADLSLKTEAPSPEQVQKAVAHLGVTVRRINYADVMYGMQFNLTAYRGFGVKSTPSVVVHNEKTRKVKILEGAAAITQEAVMKAVGEVKS